MSNSKFKQIVRDHYGRASYLVSRFRDEAKGVAAIEFAFLAPLMLLLYVGTIEISSAVSANRKLSRASSTLGDLLTQVECVSDNTLTDMINIIDDIMYPYDNTVSTSIAGILVKGSKAEVQWARAFGTSPVANGSAYTVPAKIKTDGNFLVAVKMTMAYTPTIGWFTSPSAGKLEKTNTAINMDEEIFLRPRIGSQMTVQAGSCS